MNLIAVCTRKLRRMYALWTNYVSLYLLLPFNSYTFLILDVHVKSIAPFFISFFIVAGNKVPHEHHTHQGLGRMSVLRFWNLMLYSFGDRSFAMYTIQNAKFL